MAALTALTADAAARQARPAPPTEATAPRDAGEPIMAIVSIKTQRVTFYDADGWILRAPVSTGITGRETPAGVFAVIEKDKDHHSSLYDDAWMPNMQRITWNGIALHGGPLPGYAASHGCVRMPYGFAEKLFERTRIGMRVIISPNDAEPVEFSHKALFVPNREAIAAAPAKAEALAREAAEAAKTADEAKKAAASATRETASLTSSLRKLEWLKTRADAELAYADKALAAAKTDEAKARAEDLKQKAAAKSADLGTQLGTAKDDAAQNLNAFANVASIRGETDAAGNNIFNSLSPVHQQLLTSIFGDSIIFQKLYNSLARIGVRIARIIHNRRRRMILQGDDNGPRACFAGNVALSTGARGGVFIDALTGLQVEERSTMTPDRIVQAYAGIVEVAARGRRRRSVAMARVPMPVTETLNGVAPHRNRLRRCGGGTGPDTNATFGYFSERARTGLSLGEPCISASRRG